MIFLCIFKCASLQKRGREIQSETSKTSNILDSIAVLSDPQVEVGIGPKDKMLCYPGILHNYHNNRHTSALELKEGAHSPAGCRQRRVVGVALQDLAGKLLEVQVLEALEGMHLQEEEHSLWQAPVLEVDTGYGRVVLHSLEQEEQHFVPAV